MAVAFLRQQRLTCNGGCVVASLLSQARRGPSERFGVISMCIGSGMGAAAVIEKGPDAAAFYGGR